MMTLKALTISDKVIPFIYSSTVRPNKTSVEEAASDFVKKNSEKPSRKLFRNVKKTIESLNEVTEELLIDDMMAGGY